MPAPRTKKCLAPRTKKTKKKSQTALEKDLLLFLRGWFFALQNE
jgi:hypothetical protein